MHKLIYALGAALALALFLVLAVATCGRALIYHPTQTPPGVVERLSRAPGWRLAHVPRGDVELVGLVRASTRAPTLLFFSGNATDIATSQLLLEHIRGPEEVGLAVFAYRGYDGSGGEPAEPALHEDARELVRALGVPPAELVILGHSLGTSMAAHLAADLSREGTPPKGLVLVSPFTSVAAIFDANVPLLPVGWAVRDAHRTDRVIDEVRCPVLIIHGTDDPLIPFAHGKALAAKLGDRATFLEIRGGGHDDVLDHTRSIAAIRAMWRR